MFNVIKLSPRATIIFMAVLIACAVTIKDFALVIGAIVVIVIEARKLTRRSEDEQGTGTAEE